MAQSGTMENEMDKASAVKRLNAKSQVHAWIRYDLGVATKMTVTPEQVEKLLTRLGL